MTYDTRPSGARQNKMEISVNKRPHKPAPKKHKKKNMVQEIASRVSHNDFMMMHRISGKTIKVTFDNGEVGTFLCTNAGNYFLEVELSEGGDRMIIQKSKIECITYTPDPPKEEAKEEEKSEEGSE